MTLDAAFLAALRDVDTPTVANAIEGLEARDPTEGYADCRLRCLVAPPTAMVGRAVTVRIDSTTPGRIPDRSGVVAVLDALAASPEPAVVVLQEVGPAVLRGCHMGDVVGTMLAKRGAVGVVSGSGVRDVEGLRSLGLSVFAQGTVASRGVLSFVDVGQPVEVAGLVVRSGDLLHGDANGLVTVPTGRPQDLLDLIAEVQADEARLLPAE